MKDSFIIESFLIFALDLNSDWSMNAYISRPLYTERIKPFINRHLIKVITGQR